MLPGNWHFVDKDFLEFLDVGAIMINYFTTVHGLKINERYDFNLLIVISIILSSKKNSTSMKIYDENVQNKTQQILLHPNYIKKK